MIINFSSVRFLLNIRSIFALCPRLRCSCRRSSPEPLGKFQPHLAQSILLLKRIQNCSNVGPRPFQRGDNKEKAKQKNNKKNKIKIFFFRTTGPIFEQT